jgi:predicted ATPase
MCLLAEPDTTLIIEQPELHLHPKVQTLLADFFLSMAILGKQCIIETHSEYIINRLRFRAAAAMSETLSSLMKVYFVEKKEGNSVFRPVEVNKYGAITDWPDGFFDQSQSEAEEILRAATLKRKAEKGK